MKPKYWTYDDPEKQRCHYRGYVQVYHDHVYRYVPCTKVRKNALMALADAKALVKQLKKKVIPTPVYEEKVKESTL